MRVQSQQHFFFLGENNAMQDIKKLKPCNLKKTNEKLSHKIKLLNQELENTYFTIRELSKLIMLIQKYPDIFLNNKE